MELNREQVEKAIKTLEGAKVMVANRDFKEFQMAVITAINALSLIRELTEENERLRELGTTKEIEKELVRRETKADTVREIVERLHKHFCHDPAFLGVEQRLIMDVIDQIAKEMLGGESNEKQKMP